MKVLFFSSNPTGQDSLLLEREINELQRLALQSGGKNLSFVFLPDLAFDELEQHLSSVKPDILHISAHGAGGNLDVSNDKKKKVVLSAASLKQLLSLQPPRLVYINACDSDAVAKVLGDNQVFAIGTSADISNHTARRGAVAFYNLLLRGSTLKHAFDTSAVIVRTLGDGLTTTLHPAEDERAKHICFYEPLKLVARFVRDRFEHRDGGYSFEVGVTGCPSDTIQVLICTDDDEFVAEDADGDIDLANLSSVVRCQPVGGEVWLDDEWIGITGDIRMFALLSTSDGQAYSVAGTLIGAFENFYQIYYREKGGVKFPKRLTEALADLKAHDGCRVRPLKES